jgi:hypothetical protein
MTHEEAHKLIQRNADEALAQQEKNALSAHLRDCLECRLYADEIKELEDVLPPLLKRQWSLQPVPHFAGAILSKKNSKIHTNTILATRTAAIGVVLLTFIFTAWQFTASGTPGISSLPVGSPLIPTPSMQLTNTSITPQRCDRLTYTVRKNDTLESIAQHFSVSKEDLLAINHMKTEMVLTNMELTIPVCNFTPTSTVHPTTFSTSYTPSTRPTTSTPGNSY